MDDKMSVDQKWHHTVNQAYRASLSLPDSTFDTFAHV